jgi:CheY-like chemotaxis protein
MKGSNRQQRCIILYIEDDPDDVFLFRRAFAHSHIPCDIHNVASVREAEDYLIGDGTYSDRQKFPVPTVIITDLAFRGESGIDFLNWLRYHPEFASIPVLCVSGTEDPRKLQQALNFGARCIGKSTMYQEVMDALESVLEEKGQKP